VSPPPAPRPEAATEATDLVADSAAAENTEEQSGVGGAITRPDAITRGFVDQVASWSANPQLKRNQS